MGIWRDKFEAFKGVMIRRPNWKAGEWFIPMEKVLDHEGHIVGMKGLNQENQMLTFFLSGESDQIGWELV